MAEQAFLGFSVHKLKRRGAAVFPTTAKKAHFVSSYALELFSIVVLKAYVLIVSQIYCSLDSRFRSSPVNV